MRLILASRSPRREELLRTAGFEFETIAADINEEVRADELPTTYVRRLAAEKSAAVSATLKGAAADDAARAGRPTDAVILAPTPPSSSSARFSASRATKRT